MPRKSYDVLLNELSECRVELGALSTDEEWNVITRRAFPFRMKREAESARYVALIRFTDPTLDHGAIRRALNVRDPSVLVRTRWNESEALCVLSDTPPPFFYKIGALLKNERVGFALAYVPYSGNVEHDYRRMVDSMQAVVSSAG